ncbi:MAG: hypothetical protein H7293_19145 [Candidatus Saccharibacteria bacterium]|nr:hypothetical protein [Rhodoferax sp.]
MTQPFPNIAKSSPIFDGIQAMFRPADWDEVLCMFNSSETFKGQIYRFEADMTVDHAEAISIDPNDRAGSFVVNNGKQSFAIGIDWFLTPEKFAGVLAHELGHYVNAEWDNATINYALSTRDIVNYQIALFGREGFAINNGITIAREINLATGVSIPINGQPPNVDLTAIAPRPPTRRL